jgi:hypothetical protein
VCEQERCDFADDYARLQMRLRILGVQLTTQRLAVRHLPTRPTIQPHTGRPHRACHHLVCAAMCRCRIDAVVAVVQGGFASCAAMLLAAVLRASLG